MYKYMLNVGFFVNSTVSEHWCKFMKEKFIPVIVEKGDYHNIYFSKVLSNGPADDHTFSLLVHFETLDSYNYFLKVIMNDYSEYSSAMYNEKATHLITLLKSMN